MLFSRIFRISSRCLSSTAVYNYRIERPFCLHKLDVGPDLDSTITAEEAKCYLKQMISIRKMENCANMLYRERLINGFLHLSNGQEAVGVGIKAAMDKNDAMISTYRSHGLSYLMGVSIREILSELVGSSEGCSKGKGGSMHTYGHNFYGGCAIVGAQVPIGTGVAFTFKYRNQPNVCITLYGDGAANQGQVHEAFNMAYLMKLPVIYVCENNQYGMGTAAVDASANIKFYTRGDVIPGIMLDGMDVIAVRDCIRFAKQWCTNNGGPIIIEMQTYRYMGHSMSDPGTSYRTKQEIKAYRSKDPIKKFQNMLLQSKIITESDIKTIEESATEEVDTAEAKARQSAKPANSELFTDVYSTPVDNLIIRGVDRSIENKSSVK